MTSPNCPCPGDLTKLSTPRWPHKTVHDQVTSPNCQRPGDLIIRSMPRQPHKTVHAQVTSPNCLCQGDLTKLSMPRWPHQIVHAQVTSPNFLRLCDLTKLMLCPKYISRWTYRFNPVPNAHDELPFLAHVVDKVHGDEAWVVCFTELLGCCIQSSTKSVPLQHKIVSEKHSQVHWNRTCWNKSQQTIGQTATVVRMYQRRICQKIKWPETFLLKNGMEAWDQEDDKITPHNSL